MTTQRLVFWSIRDFGIEVTPANPVVVDLNHDALLKRYPALAKAIGRGRVTSHSIVHWGAAGPIITFIVED
jgi:hypothetical protein